MTRRGNNEGSIYKRQDGRWAASVSLLGGKRKALYGKTRAEVAQKMKKAQQSIDSGLPLPSERVTLAAYLEHWLEDSVKQSVRPYTFQSYSMLVHRHIIPELGRIALAKLSPQDVQSLLNHKRESGLSPRTVQYIHSIVRRALGQAERWGMVPRNVARLVSSPHVPQANISPLSPVEAKQLLAAVHEDRLSALYTVALAVGLRQSEALGLRWQDVNIEAGTVSVRVTLQRQDGQYVLVQPKTERSRRTIKLPEVCIDALRNHQERQTVERVLAGSEWQEWGLVFTAGDGSPLSRMSVTHRFQRVLADSGIAKHRFHDLRHTCATLLLAQGVALRVVMETLGHSQMSTTADIYAHVLPVLMADAADKMNAVLTGS
jgi:integrase